MRKKKYLKTTQRQSRMLTPLTDVSMSHEISTRSRISLPNEPRKRYRLRKQSSIYYFFLPLHFS